MACSTDSFIAYKSNYGSSLMNMYVSSSGDITPPRGVRSAMEMQAEAERKKRAQILESEGTSSSP